MPMSYEFKELRNGASTAFDGTRFVRYDAVNI